MRWRLRGLAWLCVLTSALAGQAAALAGSGASAAAAEFGAEEGKAFNLTGYYKNFLVLLEPANIGGDPAPAALPPQGLASGDLRLNLMWHPVEKYSLCLAYDLIPTVGGNSAQITLPLPPPDPFVYRLADLAPDLFPQPGSATGNFILSQNLDRAYVSGSFGLGDVTLGRQPVAFGSAKVINPMDVLAPFTFQALDKEERTGVDAIRIRTPLGDLGEIDAGWVLGGQGRPDMSAVFVKPRIHVLDTDVTPLIMKFRTHGLLGLDLTRSLGGASVWLETACVAAGWFAQRNTAGDYWRVSAGADYNLADGLYGFLEYHYNGAGEATPADYPADFAKSAYAEGAVYLLGRHYLAPGLSYQLSPLLMVAAQALINLGDGSAFVAPSCSYSFADNVEVSGGFFLNLGRPAVQAPELEARSEFGMYPGIGFVETKLYF
jgi:hypothetical protein